MKAGIVTFYSANNYGAVLQCYALSETIKSLGFEVELIDLPLHAKPKDIRTFLREKVLSISFSGFRKHFLPEVTVSFSDKNVYIFGSDQIWNPQITNSNYDLFFGSWVKNNTPKISYAASFGLATWNYPSYTNLVKEQLNSFKSIGVRESSGVDICKNTFNVDSEKVLDPTLLLKDYTGIFKRRKASSSLVAYFLCKDELKVQQVRCIGEKRNLNPVILKDYKIRNKIKSVAFPSVSKWLSYLESSELVLTDSFHCMVFAILFKKNFIVIPAIPERVDRMLSLLKDLGLESRFFHNINDDRIVGTISKDIDYLEVDKKLDRLRSNSIAFLNRTIKFI
ncbi:MAG: hypothetical protein ACI849_000484 [Patiriisocius sp.]